MATRQSKTKGQYGKAKHSFEILGQLDPDKVQEKSKHVRRSCSKCSLSDLAPSSAARLASGSPTPNPLNFSPFPGPKNISSSLILPACARIALQ